MRLIWKSLSGRIWVVLCGVFFFNTVTAQNIILNNPSFEGRPGRDSIAAGWIAASNTPDILPGIFNIKRKAADGNTYAGMHSGPGYKEALAQKLSGEMIGGMTYELSMSLAYTPSYLYKTCYASLSIYGGNKPGDTAQLLWKSGAFTDTAWRRFNAVLTPFKNYTYISFWADPIEYCDKSSYGCGILLDNFSMLRQIFKTELSATRSCKIYSTGSIAVKVTSGQAPFKYLWMPGNYTTAEVDSLPAGTYTVKVTAANGLTDSGQVTVYQSDLDAKVIVTNAVCSGDNNSQIKVDVSGGVPPYRFYLNEIKGLDNPVFNNLEPGSYNLMVKDQECFDTFQIAIKEPLPLETLSVSAIPCSCSETNDGKIVLKVTGGTEPYEYRLYNEYWTQNNIFTNLKAGSYQYEIKDANGCNLSGSETITSPNQNCPVIIPSAFSPNGDGNNDVFRPRIYYAIKDYQLSVFNRWGALVFRTSDPNVGWDGANSPVQAFIYVCTFSDMKNERKEFRGSLMLLR